MRTCVIIPTLNEAISIPGLLKRIHEHKLDLEVVVIDDGSTDNTHHIAKEHGATVIRNQVNLGKGASLLKGFSYALERDFEAVITMDGDGQHSPADIPYFIRLAKHSDSAILVGNRMKRSHKMPQLRRATNKFMSWIISIVVGQRIPDTQCGFRLIKIHVLKNINLRTKKYEIESEMLIRGSRKGYKIESVEIETIYEGTKSQIHPFKDTLRFLRFIIAEIWRSDDPGIYR